jgi:hypothetical protein
MPIQSSKKCLKMGERHPITQLSVEAKKQNEIHIVSSHKYITSCIYSYKTKENKSTFVVETSICN